MEKDDDQIKDTGHRSNFSYLPSLSHTHILSHSVYLLNGDRSILLLTRYHIKDVIALVLLHLIGTDPDSLFVLFLVDACAMDHHGRDSTPERMLVLLE